MADTALSPPAQAVFEKAGRARRSGRVLMIALVVGGFALAPIYAAASEQPILLTLVSRVMIYALAASGLNLVLGYGGQVSFGHALYLGIGAYAVGILSAHGVTSGVAQLGAALVVGAVAAGVIGLVCLRTGGIAFIMITLAFAQMAYYFAVGLKKYGGDDGLPIAARSDLGPIHLGNDTVLYYVIFAILMATLLLLHRVVHARFGLVLRGTKANRRRMAALGFATLRYELSAYVASALICVIAGMLLANLTRFASPSYMEWSISGELIALVVLGGLGTLLGPVVGAIVWLLIEEVLTSTRFGLGGAMDDLLHDHWMLALGVIVVIATLALKQGLYGWFLESEQ